LRRTAASKLLEGIVVADFSRILAGPLATQLLADAGARVIKVEEIGRGDETRRWGPPFVGDESAYFLSLNRNKESLTLNLKSTAGKRIARQLVASADIVVQNFLPAQQKAFGLTAAQVHRVNRRAVHCSIRGYDRESIEADLPGYDLLAQAGAGLMAITGPADGDPSKVGVALSDVLTAHHAHGGILAALFARERSGRGVAVEVSIFGSTIASLVNVAQNYLVTGREPQRFGNEHPSIVPYQAFHASDRLFVVAVATDRHYSLLCSEVLGDAVLLNDARFATNALRVQNRKLFVPLVETKFRGETAEVWVERCRRVGIPAEKVQTFDEIFAGAGAPLLDLVEHESLGTLRLVGSPTRIDGERSRTKSAPPSLGAHSSKILRELGYNAAQVRRLKKDGIV
jgi:crotonobetainyl-CoA:carnitine CoA-transferase CaiB-like acyl-CoA transferase